jgi:ElaB/YqjD/DUF883 family membrane-anchored ribosome-binding protein
MQRQNGPGAGRKTAAEDESLTERAAGVLHESVDALKERLEPREEQLREAAASANEKLRNAGDQYGELADQAREYVRMHPLTSAAVAFAAGVVFVSWLRRR